jgi:opacity protein-like surface antigen
MKKISVLVGVVFLLGTLARAQADYPKAELNLGYTYMRIAPSGNVNSFNANGGQGQLQYNLSHGLGIVADLGAVTNGNISAHATNFPGDQMQFWYLFGPRVSLHKGGKFTPFFEFELGGVHNSRSFTVDNAVIPLTTVVPSGVTVERGTTTTKFRSTQNAFAMAAGGGVDIKLTHAIAVRPIELDYFPTHFSPFNFSTATGTFPEFNTPRWQHNLRYSAGVTFRFGGGSGY